MPRTAARGTRRRASAPAPRRRSRRSTADAGRKPASGTVFGFPCRKAANDFGAADSKLLLLMIKRVIAERGQRKAILMDSISHVDASDAGHIVVSASHGGASSGEYAGRHKLAAVFFN